MLLCARLETADLRATISTPPIWRPAIILLPYEPDEDRTETAQAPGRTPAAPTASRAGRTSTSQKWPRRSVKDAGANTAARRCCNIARRTLRTRRSCCAGSSPVTAPTPRSIPKRVIRWSHYSRQDGRPHPGARNADRQLAVGLGAGTQTAGHRRADPQLRSQPGRRRARFTRPTASGAPSGSGSGSRASASSTGRGWTPARSN